MTGPGCCRVILCAALWAAGASAPAADDARAPAQASGFAGGYWAQTVPSANFAYSCRTGWHAFSFGTQGYFLYDGTISGNWWLDHGANVRLRTRSGELLILFYDGKGTLMKRRSENSGTASVFGTELKLYRRCGADTDSVVR